MAENFLLSEQPIDQDSEQPIDQPLSMDNNHFEKEMSETVLNYEIKHGEIDLNDSKKMSIMYVNKDDAMVWNMLPLTDIQKKFIFIKVVLNTALLAILFSRNILTY